MRGQNSSTRPRLLGSKLRPPPKRGFLVPRTRLDKWIEASRTAKLVLLRAPAGFGKSSVMLQWRDRLREQDIPTAWVNITAADNDVGRFLSYLGAALGRIDPDLELRDFGSTFGISTTELQMYLMEWISEREEPLALFLDEFEVVRNGEVHDIVRHILDHLPENGLVLISTRETPQIGVGRLRTGRHLIDIGPEELRFSLEETERFLRRDGIAELDREDLIRLQTCTEGWIAGLQLAALALSGREDRKNFLRTLKGSHADFVDYLEEEVLLRQPAEVRDFLLKTSILERMAGPLCDALTGRSDGYETLEYLERSNLFLIPLDDERDWYRYHNLFGQFLRNRLERGFTDQIGGLHRAAAEWFSEHGRPAEAVEHMLATGCSDRAAGLMAGCWREIYAAGQARTVAAWVERLPRETLERHPTLEVAHCWTQCAQGRYDQAVTSLKALSSGDRQQRLDPLDRDEMYTLESTIPLLEGRIEECHREVEVNLPKLSRTGSFAHGVASNALGFCLTTAGRFDEADAVLKRGLKSHSQTGSMYGTVFALCSLGWGELSQGHLTAGLAHYRTAMARAREVIPRASIPGSVAAIFLADVLFEMDRLGEAEQLLSDHFALIPKVSILDVVVLGYLTFARIRFMQSRRKEAMWMLDQAELAGQERKSARVEVAVRLERARLALLEGNVETADQLLRKEDEAVWRKVGGRCMPINDPETWEIGKARLSLRKGEAQAALGQLRAELRRAESERRGRRAARIQPLMAAALEACGQHRAALRALSDAVHGAGNEGFVRTFADEGAVVSRLAEELRGSGPDSDLGAPKGRAELPLCQILAAGGRFASRDPAVVEFGGNELVPAEPLTKREVEILELVAHGRSNRAIAARLFVSVATVKFHLHKINQKFGAKNRMEAVARARQQGLVG